MDFSPAMLKRLALSIVRNLLALAIFWLIALALVQFGERTFGGWVAPWAGLTLACIVGTAIASKMRATVTTLFLAAITLFAASRFVIQPVFGAAAVRGRETHLISIAIAMAVVLVAAAVARVMTRRRAIA